MDGLKAMILESNSQKVQMYQSSVQAHTHAPPPPMMPPGGGNKFSGGIGKRRGAQVLNPFKNSLSNPALSANLPPPGELFAPVAPISVSPEESAGAGGPGGPGAPGAPPPAVAPGATTPEGGPVFFNPSNYGNGPPTTRRSKY